MTSSWSPAQTYEAYLPQHRLYEQAAETVEARLRTALSANGIPLHMASGRAKEPLEVFKKQARKHYSDPWRDFPDFVGARLILPTSDLKSGVVASIRSSPDLRVLEVEDQQIDAEPEMLQYRGLHVHVAAPDLKNHQGVEIRCEVQVRTIAEHAWSETNHRYLYKKPINIPNDVRRTFMRLLVLVEMFDEELAKGARMMKGLESFKALELARHLETVLGTFTAQPNDLSLTLDAISSLTSAGYDAEELGQRVDEYVAKHADTVTRLMEEHGPGADAFDVSRDWFLSQAESVLILALLDEDEYRLGSALEGSEIYTPIESLALRTDHPGFVERN